MLCAFRLIFDAHGLIFDGIEGVRSTFHVVPSMNLFQWYRGHQAYFSCFTLSNSISAVLRALDPLFMFCAPRLIFGGTVGAVSSFYILRYRTHFRRYQGHRIFFSYFALLDLFSTVQRTWGPILCFAPSVSFSAVPRALGPIFMFCAPGHVFSDTEGVRSSFYVLLTRTRFRWYRGCRILFSCLTLLESLLEISRASSQVFMFYAPGFVFCGTEGVGSNFHVLCSRTHF
jgi:hypothetical protein